MEEEDTPLQIAIQRMKEKFKREGALENIDSIISDSSRQNQVLETQISSLSTEIVLQIGNALSKLEESNDCMEDIKLGVANINERCQNSVGLIDGFNDIKVIVRTLKNVEKTNSSLRVFRNLKDQFRIIDLIFENEWKRLRRVLPRNIELLIPAKYDPEAEFEEDEKEKDEIDFLSHESEGEEEEEEEDFDTKGLTIFNIQKQINTYRTLLIESKLQLEKNHLKQFNIISKTLRRVPRIEADFKILFKKFTRHILDYCVNNPEIIEILVECIEYQERKDRINERELKQHVIKLGLRDIFFSEVKISIEDSFDFEEGRRIVNLEDQLQEIEVLSRNLKYIEKHVGAKFPKDFRVTEFYIQTTYVSTIVWLRTTASEKMGNSEKLQMRKWIKHSYPSLFEPFKDLIRISSLQQIQNNLEDSFFESSSRLMVQWSDNIVKEIFKKSMKPLQISDNDPIYTPGPKELFDIISQYIEQVWESIKLFKEDPQTKLFFGRVLLILKSVILNYAQNIIGELKLLEKNGQVEVAVYIPYINDFSNLISYLMEKRNDTIKKEIFNSLEDSKWIEWMEEKIPGVLENFSDECLNILKRNLFSRLIGYLNEVFGSRWSSGHPIVKDLVSYLGNSLDDLEDLEEEYREEIEVGEFVVREYIRRLFFSQRKFSQKDLKIIKDDIKCFRNEIEKKKTFKALEMVFEIMMCNEEKKFVLIFGSVLKTFPDFPRCLVEELVRKSNVVKKKQKIMIVIEAHYPKGIKKSLTESLFSRINFKRHPSKDESFL